MEAPTPGQVVAELLAVPLAEIEEARATAPATPGFYAWWCEADAVPGDAPAPPHPTEPALNRTHNQRHPFYTSMGVAQNDLRRAARGEKG